MKKTFVAFAIFIVVVFTSNAQVFVGGGLGIDYAQEKDKNGSTSYDAYKAFALNLSPKVGYFLNDDFAIGLEVGLLTGTYKIPSSGSSGNDRKYSLTGWSVDAFARRNLVGTEKFALLLEGSLGVGGVKGKSTYGSTTNEGDPTFVFAVGVQPVLSYSVTDRLSIEAACNFLRFGFQSATTKIGNNSNNKETVTTLGLGVNSSTINVDYGGDISLSNPLSVGIVFRF